MRWRNNSRTVTERLAVVLIGWCGALAALLESMLVPWYVGTFLMPVATILAVLSNIALPILGRQAIPHMGAAAAPFLAWLAVVIALAGVGQSEGDVIFPGGNAWLTVQSYGVIFGGTLAGAVTLLILATPAPKPREVEVSSPAR
jgi:hypothetical protein